MHFIDAGLVLYVGLFGLFIWRQLCGWRCCGKWFQYANYCSLLLLLVLTILAYDSYMFFTAVVSDSGKLSWNLMPSWLKPFMLVGPCVNLLTFMMCAFQVFQHVERIREESAVPRHDRAVQIILLPLVYSSMAMTSLTRMYTFVTSSSNPFVDPAKPSLGGSTAELHAVHLAVSRSEACFYVGDLYEAWALFQFGQLVLELIESGIIEQATTGRDLKKQAAANALLQSHKAVEALAWLGIWSFLLVCVGQAGWSLWLLTIADTTENYDSSMSQFYVAGFLASCAAIYNVYIVENRFEHYLDNFYPNMKFLTVKILVSIAFVQRGAFSSLATMGTYLPSAIQKWPWVKQFMHIPPAQFAMFYASLIAIECFIIGIVHQWAWNSKEAWYDEIGQAIEDLYDDESRKLLPKPVDGVPYGIQSKA